jgi:hypothetical protein
MSFYVTLPSNSSFEYYPENTLNNYTTKLHSTLRLEGNNEVGLVEMSYPKNWIYKKELLLLKEKNIPCSFSYNDIEQKMKLMSSLHFILISVKVLTKN